MCSFIIECDTRRYGDGCQRNCGHCFNMAQCDHVNGTCLQGCEAGFLGQMCDQGQWHVIKELFQSSVDNTAIYHFQKEETFCKILFYSDKQKCFISYF